MRHADRFSVLQRVVLFEELSSGRGMKLLGQLYLIILQQTPAWAWRPRLIAQKVAVQRRSVT